MGKEQGKKVINPVRGGAEHQGKTRKVERWNEGKEGGPPQPLSV